MVSCYGISSFAYQQRLGTSSTRRLLHYVQDRMVAAIDLQFHLCCEYLSRRKDDLMLISNSLLSSLLCSRLLVIPIIALSFSISLGQPVDCKSSYQTLLILYSISNANACGLFIIRTIVSLDRVDAIAMD
jgi:hypothetical protein